MLGSPHQLLLAEVLCNERGSPTAGCHGIKVSGGRGKCVVCEVSREAAEAGVQPGDR